MAGNNNDDETANAIFFDATIRHQIAVRRYTAGEIKAILALMEKADAELASYLRQVLRDIVGSPIDFKSKRIESMMTDIKAARSAMMSEVQKQIKAGALELAAEEVDAELKILEVSIPVVIEYATVNAAKLKAAVTGRPFSGGKDAARTLQQWFDSLARADQIRITEAVQLGLSQGETIDQMVKRIIGTRAESYADGVVALSRRDAETTVITAFNHTSNVAREEVWDANADILEALRWTSVLDGRTSAICRSRDGCLAPIGATELPKGARKLDPPGARPPAHPRCRSIMVAIISGEGVMDLAGNRPFVRSTRTGDQRQLDFAKDAKAQAGDKWKTMSKSERAAATRSVRTAWANDNIGRVPAATSYGEWLKKQPSKFIDEVLGETKGKAFRDGKLKIEQFTDRAGNELTIKELRARHPGAL